MSYIDYDTSPVRTPVFHKLLLYLILSLFNVRFVSEKLNIMIIPRASGSVLQSPVECRGVPAVARI